MTSAEFERYHMKMTLRSIADTNAVGLNPDPWGAVADHVLKLVEAARQSTAPLPQFSLPKDFSSQQALDELRKIIPVTLMYTVSVNFAGSTIGCPMDFDDRSPETKE